MDNKDRLYLNNLLDRLYWEGFNRGGEYVRDGKPLTAEQVAAREKFLTAAKVKVRKRIDKLLAA